MRLSIVPEVPPVRDVLQEAILHIECAAMYVESTDAFSALKASYVTPPRRTCDDTRLGCDDGSASVTTAALVSTIELV